MEHDRLSLLGPELEVGSGDPFTLQERNKPKQGHGVQDTEDPMMSQFIQSSVLQRSQL